MKNLDIKQLDKAEIWNKIKQAIDNDDKESFVQSLDGMLNMLQEQVMQEARELQATNDVNVLASRGVRQLTSQENNYYQKVIEAMQTSNPQQALTELDVVMPETVIDSVFEDLKTNHPLLEVIKFQNTSGYIEMLLNDDESQLAKWGTLTSAIAEEISSSFKKVNMGLNKLSAFLPVAKSMLDLGAKWMDKYVRTVLYEAIAFGLEDGIINGTGKNQPIGMIRQIGKGVAKVDDEWPEKTPIKFDDLDPVSYGTILGGLAKTPNGKTRNVTGVVLIVNPVDYLTKIFPATTVRAADGTYRNDVFPFPTKPIQSVCVKEGRAVIGIPKCYFMGVGTAKSGKIEYSDDYKFLEDERYYLVKLYGHGEPKDNNAFQYLDITDLEPAYHKVFIANASDEPVPIYETTDARLETLTIGTLDLSPEFNKSHFVYTATTDNATNTIKAVPCDDTATVEIKVNGSVVTNDSAATWTDGDNAVVVKVVSGAKTETYNITVTKTTA